MTKDATGSRLSEVQRNLNASNATMGKSVFELLYGYQARRNEGELRKATNESTSYTTPPAKLQQTARVRIEAEQQKIKERYDRNRVKNVQFNVGDIVYMRIAPTATGESTKLQYKYREPLIITQVLYGDTYKV